MSSKLTTDVIFSVFIRLAVRLRGLIFIPLITAYLGVAAFGAYTQILAVVQLFELVFGLGLYSGLVRYGQQTDTEGRADLYYSLLLLALLSSGVVTALVFLAAPIFTPLALGSGEYTTAYKIGSLLIITRTVIRMSRNYFRIDSRIKLFSAIQGVKAYGLVIGVAATTVVLEEGLTELFISMVVVETATLVIIHLQIVREIGITIPRFRNVKKHLTYSVPVAISSLAGNISSRADRVMIGYFLGASAVGIYSIAYQISVVVTMYTNPMRQTFFPEFSKLIDEDKQAKCRSYLQIGVRYFLIIAIPTVGGLYLIGPNVASVLSQRTARPSAILTGIIALGFVSKGVYVLYGVVLDAVEATALRSKIQGIGAAVNILINVVAIPLLGILGAALATFLTASFTAVLTIQNVSTFVPNRLPWKTALRCSFATLLMIVVVKLTIPNNLVLVIGTSVFVYFAVLFATREISIQEIQEGPTV